MNTAPSTLHSSPARRPVAEVGGGTGLPFDPRAPRIRRAADSSALWVQVTLGIVVAGLLLAVIAVPRPRPDSRAAVTIDLRAPAGTDASSSAEAGSEQALRVDLARLRASMQGDGTAPIEFPVNPVSGLSSIRVLGPDEPWPEAADGSTGWIYRPGTGEIRAGCAGTVRGTGVRYYDL